VIFLSRHSHCFPWPLPPVALAASAAEIDKQVDAALVAFQKIDGAKSYLWIAKGVLVFPKVYKAGIGIGGEYSEGTLRIGGKTVDYYRSSFLWIPAGRAGKEHRPGLYRSGCPEKIPSK